MHLSKVKIRNFRKLMNCDIDFDKNQTIFVGANNSGKTSAMSALQWFIDKADRFSIQDFTITVRKEIMRIGHEWLDDSLPDNSDKWNNIVPSIDIWLEIKSEERFKVQKLIPSLTWNSKLVGARLIYQPKDLADLKAKYLESRSNAQNVKNENGVGDELELYPKDLLDYLSSGGNLNKFFGIQSFLLDATTDLNAFNVSRVPVENIFNSIIKVSVIEASRDFSDPEGKQESPTSTLSFQLREYYEKHLRPSGDIRKEDLEILKAIQATTKTIDESLKESFKPLLDNLNLFNYPGFQNPKLEVKSRHDISAAINHDSAVNFAVPDGDNQSILPEKYNGLGYRNLLSIYFRLMQFRDAWLRKGRNYEDITEEIPPIHLVLIEEPEAHLHAQMQKVFIQNALKALKSSEFLQSHPELTTQLVVSTHSSHITNAVDMDSMRYFKREKIAGNIPLCKVINLNEVFGDDKASKEFVTRYIKLMHCDLFFADAVILVEGAAEKILMPLFLEEAYLENYYVSVIEVNGSHAHRFKPLIERLEILTLIVSDIDAGKYENKIIKNGKTRPVFKAHLTTKGQNLVTGNETLSKWIPEKENIDELLDLADSDKIKGDIRIAYQYRLIVNYSGKDENVYPYTFEDAVLFTNIDFFKDKKFKKMNSVTSIANLMKKNASLSDFHEALFKKLENKSISKADLAILLLYSSEFKNLKAPKYILEGLTWLKERLDSARPHE